MVKDTKILFESFGDSALSHKLTSFFRSEKRKQLNLLNNKELKKNETL